MSIPDATVTPAPRCMLGGPETGSLLELPFFANVLAVLSRCRGWLEDDDLAAFEDAWVESRASIDVGLAC